MPPQFYLIVAVAVLVSAGNARADEFSFTPEQIEYFSSFPAWMLVAWTLGVWGSLLGSIGLLMRKAWAVKLFAISILGLAVSSVYNFVLTNGMDVMGQTGAIFTGVIWLIVLFLFFYSKAQARNNVLT